jgi:hypothetical protein
MGSLRGLRPLKKTVCQDWRVRAKARRPRRPLPLQSLPPKSPDDSAFAIHDDDIEADGCRAEDFEGGLMGLAGDQGGEGVVLGQGEDFEGGVGVLGLGEQGRGGA